MMAKNHQVVENPVVVPVMMGVPITAIVFAVVIAGHTVSRKSNAKITCELLEYDFHRIPTTHHR